MRDSVYQTSSREGFTVVSPTVSVRLRLKSIRLRLLCQFAYVFKHVLQQLIHLLYVRSRSDASQSI